MSSSVRIQSVLTNWSVWIKAKWKIFKRNCFLIIEEESTEAVANLVDLPTTMTPSKSCPILIRLLRTRPMAQIVKIYLPPLCVTGQLIEWGSWLMWHGVDNTTCEYNHQQECIVQYNSGQQPKIVLEARSKSRDWTHLHRQGNLIWRDMTLSTVDWGMKRCSGFRTRLEASRIYMPRLPYPSVHTVGTPMSIIASPL